MAWHEWNRILDSILQVAGSAQTEGVDHRFKSDNNFARLKVGQNVQKCVRRFMYSTMPHKLWFDTFDQRLRREMYKEIHYVRKYDGWFVVLLINKDSQVEWQTMGGYIFPFIQQLLQPFIRLLERLVSDGKLQPDHAFKIEFTARNKQTKAEVLHEIGFKSSEDVDYVAVVTDYFAGYTDQMDDALFTALTSERSTALLRKAPDVDAKQWRGLWIQNGAGNIMSRLNEANKVLEFGVSRRHEFTNLAVEVAEAHNIGLNPNPVFQLSRELVKNSIEGYVLHCTGHMKEMKGRAEVLVPVYDIYKLKLEQLGGLGHYYSWPVTDAQFDMTVPDNIEKVAGRQFLVRALVAECLPGCMVPYAIGVGYWNPAKQMTRARKTSVGCYLVTDRFMLKGITNRSYRNYGYKKCDKDPRYLQVGTATDDNPFAKHNELTKSCKAMANCIAHMIYHRKSTVDIEDFSNLGFTDHFLDDTSRAYINISKLGILIGGSASSVYVSVNGNYHIQAAVVKCMGLDPEGGDVEFDANALEDMKAKTLTPMFTCVDTTKVNEWSLSQWADMSDLNNLNKSSILSANRPVSFQTVLFERNGKDFQEPQANYDRTPIDFAYMTVWFYMCKPTKQTVENLVQNKVYILNAKPDKVDRNTGIPLSYKRKGAGFEWEDEFPDDVKIDILVIARQEFKSYAKEMNEEIAPVVQEILGAEVRIERMQEHALYTYLTTKLKHRFIVTHMSYAKENMSAVVYTHPNTKRLEFRRPGNDSDGNPWIIQDDDVNAFLKLRQKERTPPDHGAGDGSVMESPRDSSVRPSPRGSGAEPSPRDSGAGPSPRGGGAGPSHTPSPRHDIMVPRPRPSVPQFLEQQGDGLEWFRDRDAFISLRDDLRGQVVCVVNNGSDFLNEKKLSKYGEAFRWKITHDIQEQRYLLTFGIKLDDIPQDIKEFIHFEYFTRYYYYLVYMATARGMIKHGKIIDPLPIRRLNIPRPEHFKISRTSRGWMDMKGNAIESTEKHSFERDELYEKCRDEYKKLQYQRGSSGGGGPAGDGGNGQAGAGPADLGDGSAAGSKRGPEPLPDDRSKVQRTDGNENYRILEEEILPKLREMRFVFDMSKKNEDIERNKWNDLDDARKIAVGKFGVTALTGEDFDPQWIQTGKANMDIFVVCHTMPFDTTFWAYYASRSPNLYMVHYFMFQHLCNYMENGLPSYVKDNPMYDMKYFLDRYKYTCSNRWFKLEMKRSKTGVFEPSGANITLKPGCYYWRNVLNGNITIRDNSEAERFYTRPYAFYDEHVSFQIKAPITFNIPKRLISDEYIAHAH